MGVHGLWQLLEPTASSFHLDHLEGKRLAVDLSIWLCQAGGFHGSNLSQCPHLSMLITRISKLLYYKVRPVFVFDGDMVPVFKQQVKRDRRLRSYMTEMVTTRSQKEVFKQLAEGRLVDGANCDNAEPTSSSNIAQRMRVGKRSNDDIFALSDDVKKAPIQAERKQVPQASIPDYLDGYDDLLTTDARFTFLTEAKEKAKQSRLTPGQIPEDSNEFSNFQLRRLIGKNKINIQLEVLKKQKLEQCTRIADDQLKYVARDQNLRSHLLVEDGPSKAADQEAEQREKLIRESLSWPQFMKEYHSGFRLSHDDSAATEEGEEVEQARSDSLFLPTKSFEDVDEDLQTAIINSIIEENPRRANLAPLPDYRSEEDSVEYMDETSSTSESISSSRQSLEEDEVDEGEYYPRRKSPTGPEANILRENKVYEDCQKLLTLLGIPYIFAPGEAEAQCVKLEQLKLVDGVISDDSDVWLFGSTFVYRNMFSRTENPEEYRIDSIREELGLTRQKFIQLGMLSGGDYSNGLEGVGMVAATELIAEFPPSLVSEDDDSDGLETLVKVREWLQSDNKKKEVESTRRRKLRRIIEKYNDAAKIAQFPNVEVYKAYADPAVENSDKKFEWARVKFDELYEFLNDKMGLTKRNVQKITNGAFDIWDAFLEQATREYQSRITTFFDKSHGEGRYRPYEALASKRVRLAIEHLKDQSSQPNSKEVEPTGIVSQEDLAGREGNSASTRRVSKRLQGKRV